MNNSPSLKIVVAETSVIIRSGLASVLKRIPNLNAQPVEIGSPESLSHYMQMHTPDIVIANPTFGGWFDLAAFKASHERAASTRFMALVCSVIDQNVLKAYDGHFSICDDTDTISEHISRLLHTGDEEVHTIITHRRNIARKLQIHSPAGLTIYAIVNKLVALEDIKL